MAGKVEVQGSAFDTVKMIVSVMLLVLGVAGFYYYAEESTLYRVLGLLAIVGVVIGIMLTTAKGKSLWGFLKESRTEVRKMVWPTRAETVQTTLIVFVLVIIVGIFLWLLDMFLGWAIRFVIG